jgi:hypothetical protein
MENGRAVSRAFCFVGWLLHRSRVKEEMREVCTFALWREKRQRGCRTAENAFGAMGADYTTVVPLLHKDARVGRPPLQGKMAT